MDLKIFDSIIFGGLRPFFGENKDEAYFISKLNPKFILPDNMDQLEDQLRIALKDHPLLLDSEEYLIKLNPDEKVIEITSIRDDIFEPLIDIDIQPPFNSTTEFYYYLIKNVEARSLSKLFSEVNAVGNPIDAKFIIQKTISQIEFLLKNLSSELKALSVNDNYYEENKNETDSERIKKNTHYVFTILKRILIRLYYEMETQFSSSFDIVFKPQLQFYSEVVGEKHPALVVREMSKSFAIVTVKKIIEAAEFDVAKAYSIWTELNMYFQNDKSNIKLEQALAAIENKLILESNLLESKNYSFTDLHSYKLFDDISSQVKEICKNAINKKNYGFERLETVDDFIDAISKQFKGHNFENELIDNSIPRNLFKWLGIQTKLYSSELSKSFAQQVVIAQEKEVQQDRKTESLFIKKPFDFKDLGKNVLAYDVVVRKPSRFADFEEKLFSNGYIGLDYKFTNKHGLKIELALIYHYLISKNYFIDRLFPKQIPITPKQICKFLDYRYTTICDKEFRNNSNNPNIIAEFVDKHYWLSNLPSC